MESETSLGFGALGWRAAMAAMLAVVSGGWLLSRRAHSIDLEHATARMAALEKRVSAAEAGNVTGSSVLQALATSPAASKDGAHTADSIPPTPPHPAQDAIQQSVDTKLEMETRQLATLQRLEETLSHDTIDPDARSAASTLRAVNQGEEFVGVEVAVDCRQTICGIKLSGGDPDRTRRAMQLVATKLPWEGNGMSYFDFASGEATIYVSRQGKALPQFQAPDSR